MRGPHFKYVMLALGLACFGAAVLLDHLVRHLGLPNSLLELTGACAILLPAAWLWRQRARLEGTVRGLIGAAEQIGRGELHEAVVSTGRDRLGELEAAFENMRQALRTTTFSRNYLHSVLNSMNDAVFVTAPGGVVRIANEAALRLTGFSEQELLGRDIVALL